VPSHEHLVSSVLHDIISETMRSFVPRPGAPGLLVTTPAGDRHSIGAALVGAAAAVEGWNVLYLGADLPADDIADAARTAGVIVVAVSIVYVENRARVLDELRTLRSRLSKKISLIAGGSGAATLAAELTAMDIKVSPSVPGLIAELRRDQPHRQERR
jgi:methylmalonyl-CoA mutase cobalamin-binding subunit